MATTKHRYQVSVSNRMLAEIEEYREKNGIATCSGAVQELVMIGLRAIQEEKLRKEFEDRRKKDD